MKALSKTTRYESSDTTGKPQERKELPSREKSQEHKEDLSIPSQSLNKLFDFYEGEALRYQQSMVELQKEFNQAYRITVEAVFSFQESVTDKLPFYPNLELPGMRNMKDFVDTFLKFNEMQNYIMLAIINAAEQNIKFMSESARHFQEMARSMMDWQFFRVR